MPVRRIAVSQDCFDASVEVQLRENVATPLLRQMKDSDVEALAAMAKDAVRVTIDGPAWQRFMYRDEETPTSLNPETTLAVKGTGYLAFPSKTWDLFDTTVHFYNASKEELATGSIRACEKIIDVNCHSTKQTYQFNPHPESAFGLVQAIQNVSLNSGECLATIPEPRLDAWSPKEQSKWATIPEWLASFFLRWSSHHLRIHVLHSACVPLESETGPSPDIFIESATIEHALQRNGDAFRRCTFRLHESVGGCVCKNHTDKHPGQHARSVLRVDFCGCNCHHSVCPYHPKRVVSSSSTDPLIDKICTHGLCVKVLCFHTDETGKFTCHTVMDVPLQDDKFMNLFASSCVELTENPQAIPTEQLQSSMETVFENAMKEDLGEWTSHEINIEMRDQMTESILRSGEYYCGPPEGKRNGKHLLRKRKKEPLSKHEREAQKIPKWMCACMTTHAHLIPRHH